jgi:selenide,water dikinase
LAEAVESMLRLNRAAAQVMQAIGVHAATDITGFSLLGHAQEMAALSGVALRLAASDIPVFESALGYAQAGYITGGASRNRHYLEGKVHFAREIDQALEHILFDPQTSGGLLIAVAPEKRSSLADELRRAGQAFWIIGTAIEGAGIEVA